MLVHYQINFVFNSMSTSYLRNTNNANGKLQSRLAINVSTTQTNREADI